MHTARRLPPNLSPRSHRLSSLTPTSRARKKPRPGRKLPNLRALPPRSTRRRKGLSIRRQILRLRLSLSNAVSSHQRSHARRSIRPPRQRPHIHLPQPRRRIRSRKIRSRRGNRRSRVRRNRASSTFRLTASVRRGPRAERRRHSRTIARSVAAGRNSPVKRRRASRLRSSLPAPRTRRRITRRRATSLPKDRRVHRVKRRSREHSSRRRALRWSGALRLI